MQPGLRPLIIGEWHVRLRVKKGTIPVTIEQLASLHQLIYEPPLPFLYIMQHLELDACWDR